MKLFLYIFLVGLTASTAMAVDTRYVTDEFKITMRSSAGKGKKIVRMLSSGQALTRLDKGKNAYAHVRTKDGKEGYVLSRFLMDQPSSRNQVAKLKAEVGKLQVAPAALQERLETNEQHLTRLQQEYRQMSGAKTDIEIELNSLKRTAADAVRIKKEQEKIKATITQQQRQLESLKQENLELKNNSQMQWFLTGAGVLFGGFLLGIILPNLNFGRRRKSSYDTF